MKQRLVAGMMAVGMMALFGCAYGGVSTVGNTHVVITRNDGLLFGLLRKVFVCKVGTSGVSSCMESENP